MAVAILVFNPNACDADVLAGDVSHLERPFAGIELFKIVNGGKDDSDDEAVALNICDEMLQKYPHYQFMIEPITEGMNV